MLIFTSWLIWSILNGFIASSNRRDVVSIVFASLLLSPLFIFLYLLAVGKNDIAPPAPVTTIVQGRTFTKLPVEPPKKASFARIGIAGIAGGLVLGALVLIFGIALVQYSAQRAAKSSSNISFESNLAVTVESGRTAWISGFDSCENSKEYGQLVASAVGLYSVLKVDPFNRIDVIPHGTEVKVLGAVGNDMQRIRYHDHVGYILDMFVVDYDPATGVRPSTEQC